MPAGWAWPAAGPEAQEELGSPTGGALPAGGTGGAGQAHLFLLRGLEGQTGRLTARPPAGTPSW